MVVQNQLLSDFLFTWSYSEDIEWEEVEFVDFYPDPDSFYFSSIFTQVYMEVEVLELHFPAVKATFVARNEFLLVGFFFSSTIHLYLQGAIRSTKFKAYF